jgi:pyruvate/2-oxoglutarate dehydrogenase complex dihydrolipoamide dehydrogenase (E3) component
MVEENKGDQQPDYISEKDGRDHGHTQEGASWSSLLEELKPLGDIPGHELQQAIGERSGLILNNDLEHLPSMMFDEHNVELFDNVHPIQWVDPAND